MTTQNYPHYFTGVLKEGKIYEQAYGGDYQQIGVAQKVYNDLADQHKELTTSYNEYQQKLIELGIIEPPLTPEEAAKKQAEELAAMREAAKAQAGEMAELRQTVGQMASMMKSMMEAAHEHNVTIPSNHGPAEPEDEGNDEHSVPSGAGYAKKSRGTPSIHKSTRR